MCHNALEVDIEPADNRVCDDPGTIQGSTVGAPIRTSRRSGDVMVTFWHFGSHRPLTISTCSPMTNFDTVLELRRGKCLDFEAKISGRSLSSHSNVHDFRHFMIMGTNLKVEANMTNIGRLCHFRVDFHA